MNNMLTNFAMAKLELARCMRDAFAQLPEKVWSVYVTLDEDNDTYYPKIHIHYNGMNERFHELMRNQDDSMALHVKHIRPYDIEMKARIKQIFIMANICEGSYTLSLDPSRLDVSFFNHRNIHGPTFPIEERVLANTDVPLFNNKNFEMIVEHNRFEITCKILNRKDEEITCMAIAPTKRNAIQEAVTKLLYKKGLGMIRTKRQLKRYIKKHKL